jgi:4-hydroxy-3-methylbut-2-enyl diphosphate reductase
MRIEALDMRLGRGRPTVRRVGYGPVKAAAGALRLAAELPQGPVALLGVARGMDPAMHHGDLVVASEVRGPGAEPPLQLPLADEVVGVLRDVGFTVHVGALLSVARLVNNTRSLADAAPGADIDGIAAIDMESAPVARAMIPTGRPFAVVRSISDVDPQPLMSWATLVGGTKGLRALRRAELAVAQWAAMHDGR